MASTITAAEFKDALSRYPAVLKKKAPAKEGQTSLEELDKYRYQYAPMNFSKNASKALDLEALQKLVDWKLRHEKYRPTMPKQIASNTDEKIAEALDEAYEHYAKNKDDIAGTIELIKKDLSGVGPATASLLLAVHDPQNVVFFSDELYKWLVDDSKKIGYTTKEFETLFAKAKAFMDRIKCTPIELEKVAYTLIQESMPVKEKKEPSGRGRGRPPLPDSEKKPKKEVVPGRGRGRPPGVKKDTNVVAAAKPKREPKEKKGKAAASPAADGTTRKRGRPSKKAEAAPESESGGEEEKEETEGAEEEVEETTPVSKKRKAVAATTGRSAKKSKA